MGRSACRHSAHITSSRYQRWRLQQPQPACPARNPQRSTRHRHTQQRVALVPWHQRQCLRGAPPGARTARRGGREWHPHHAICCPGLPAMPKVFCRLMLSAACIPWPRPPARCCWRKARRHRTVEKPCGNAPAREMKGRCRQPVFSHQQICAAQRAASGRRCQVQRIFTNPRAQRRRR